MDTRQNSIPGYLKQALKMWFDEFFLVLPSNSSAEFYPDNTVTNFTTKLPREIRLTEKWVVGLAEIHVPLNFTHFRGDEDAVYCYNVSYTPDKETDEMIVRKYRKWLDRPKADKRVQVATWIECMKYSLDNALFKQEVEFVKAIEEYINFTFNAIMEETMKDLSLMKKRRLEPPFTPINHIECSINNGFFTMTPKCTCSSNHHLQFSENISNILGFDTNAVIFTHKLKTTTAPRPITLSAATTSQIFVYCDLVEHHIVGDKSTPLLRVVSLTNNQAYGGIMEKTFSSPQYYPLATNCISTVQVDIRDSHGAPVPFLGSSLLTCVLHFKRSF